MDKTAFLAEARKFANTNPDTTILYFVKENDSPAPKKITDIVLDKFYTLWETGGVSGGVPSDSAPSRYSVSNNEPRIHSLILFLEEHFPEITYLQFRRLEDLARFHIFTEDSFYGNSTDYAILVWSFEDVWEFFNTFKFKK